MWTILFQQILSIFIQMSGCIVISTIQTMAVRCNLTNTIPYTSRIAIIGSIYNLQTIVEKKNKKLNFIQIITYHLIKFEERIKIIANISRLLTVSIDIHTQSIQVTMNILCMMNIGIYKSFGV